jgi:hypothetical protein
MATEMEKIIISWKNDIPPLIRNIRTACMFAIGGLLPFSAFISMKLGITVEEFAAYMGFAIIGVRFLSKLFGVPDDSSDVPVTVKKDE